MAGETDTTAAAAAAAAAASGTLHSAAGWGLGILPGFIHGYRSRGGCNGFCCCCVEHGLTASSSLGTSPDSMGAWIWILWRAKRILLPLLPLLLAVEHGLHQLPGYTPRVNTWI